MVFAIGVASGMGLAWRRAIEMEIVCDMAMFVAQLIVFFLVMILAFLAYDLISTSIRVWWFGDDCDCALSRKSGDVAASGKDGGGGGRDGCDGCGEGECEWPCACDDITEGEKERYFAELESRLIAQEKAEREFWERREVLVELWEPKAGDDLQC
jgi:hypothetical protein